MNVQPYARLSVKLAGRGMGRPVGSLFLLHWLDEAGEAVINGIMLYEYEICLRDTQRTRTFNNCAFLDETPSHERHQGLLFYIIIIPTWEFGKSLDE